MTNNGHLLKRLSIQISLRGRRRCRFFFLVSIEDVGTFEEKFSKDDNDDKVSSSLHLVVDVEDDSLVTLFLDLDFMGRDISDKPRREAKRPESFGPGQIRW